MTPLLLVPFIGHIKQLPYDIQKYLSAKISYWAEIPLINW